MTTSSRERRDWTLLIFIIPIGIILMLIAGQIAIHLVPIWSLDAGMQSKLDPNNLPNQQNGLVQPILPAILTPLGWLDTFLTPGADSGNQNVLFPPFVVFEPSATPAVTLPPPTAVTQPPTIPVTATSPTVVVIPPVTGTPKPPAEDTSTPPIVTTPPTVTTPIPTGFPSSPVGTLDASTPIELNIGIPDGSIANVADGHFIVLDLGSDPTKQLKVNGPSASTIYPDMVYYEMYNLSCGGICMDQVIVGISQFPNGSIYYTVFNWGDGVPDMNTNVGVVAGAEADNQPIASTYLYGPSQTGITIDVDHVPSAPPVGLYQYIVIQAPITTTIPPDGADINSIEIIPDPPMGNMSIAPVVNGAIAPTDNVPIQLVNAAPSLSTDAAPSPSASANVAPSSPADVAVSQVDAAPIPAADIAPPPVATP